MHEIQLIRCEMVQFLRGFSNFVFQSIIAAQWFSFVQRITEFNDKNELDLDRTGKYKKKCPLSKIREQDLKLKNPLKDSTLNIKII